MKKKLFIFGAIALVLVVAIIVFFVINNKQNNPLGLSSDFVLQESVDPSLFGPDTKNILPYTYKKHTDVYIKYSENHSVKAIGIMSTNSNFEKDYYERIDLINYLLDKDFFDFTKKDKIEIISHIRKNESLRIDNISISVNIEDDLFFVFIGSELF